MLFDPTVVLREPLAVLAVLAAIMIGKSVAAFVIVLVFRYPLAHRAHGVGVAGADRRVLFILAGLGVSLGLLPPEGGSRSWQGRSSPSRSTSVRVRDDRLR